MMTPHQMNDDDSAYMNSRYKDFRVIVGNVGTVYTGRDYNEAAKTFDEYQTISESGYGRAAGEEVTLIGGDDTVLAHHLGTITAD